MEIFNLIGYANNTTTHVILYNECLLRLLSTATFSQCARAHGKASIFLNSLKVLINMTNTNLKHSYSCTYAVLLLNQLFHKTKLKGYRLLRLRTRMLKSFFEK